MAFPFENSFLSPGSDAPIISSVHTPRDQRYSLYYSLYPHRIEVGKEIGSESL